ncbi:cytidylate kinase-like family protein [Bacteroidales bacterium OttesenSCG-928-M11]|nr:cytidylate kinase-like family protein [Bacteroidales bacterium OttesenSCG-928-M11]
MKHNLIITIGRQLGSGGKLIGEMLSQKLEIPCYDKELILLASKESGIEKEAFEQMDEKSRFSFFSNVYSFRSGHMGVSSGNYLTNESLFQIQSDVIRKLAEKESCIFVGRCADYILRDNTNLISTFISANIEDRIQRVATMQNITHKEAQTLIEQTDKKRAGYYNYYSNKTWGMSTSYDICINSSLLDLERTAELICEVVLQKQR